MHAIGASSPTALEIVGDVWRSFPLHAETHVQDIWRMNRETLIALEPAGLLDDRPEDRLRPLIQGWQFPMYGLDLSKIEVDLDALRERQRSGPYESY